MRDQKARIASKKRIIIQRDVIVCVSGEKGNQSNKRERQRERKPAERKKKKQRKIDVRSPPLPPEFILESGEYYVSRLSISRLLSLGMEADVTWAQS